MVLKLSEICLNFIAKEFTAIKNFDHRLLHSRHKEILIQRFIDHDLFYSQKEFDSKRFNPNLNGTYQQVLVSNFFNGHLDSIQFRFCPQIDDDFLRLVAAQKHYGDLIIKSLLIRKCSNIKGDVI